MSDASSFIPFASYPIDRADPLRKDDAAVHALARKDTARFVVLQKGRVFVERVQDRFQAVYLGPALLDWLESQSTPALIFLGVDEAGVGYFAAEIPSHLDLTDTPFGTFGTLEDLRAVGALLPAGEAGLLSTARSLFDWHRRHGYCAQCGAATDIIYQGWKRVCPACGAEHFPRTDPVVIMAIEYQDQLLLGRGLGWPEGFYSCLAGFVEPGETLEHALIREAYEEAGVVIDPASVRYAMDQPWPFPSQLMIGFFAKAEGADLTVNPEELADARWFTRDEVARRYKIASRAMGRPAEIALAHHLMAAWLKR